DIETDWELEGVSLLDLDVDRPHEPTRWCCNGEGASTDIEVLFSQVERNHRWVPDQTSWLGIAGVGEHASLIGTPTTEIDLGSDDGFTWSLDLGAELEEVDRSSGFVQTMVTGRIQSERLPESDELLIVLNDVVAGVAHLARDDVSGGAISGLVAEELVRDGVNDIELVIPGDEGVWLAGDRADLSFELLNEDGRTLELGAEGSRRIQVDSVESTEVGWEVTGWAADVVEKQTPDQVYVFVGEELIVSGPPNRDNANVVRWFESDDLLRSGFAFEVSAADIPAGIDRILVVAEFGDLSVADPATLTR
ncbi:MAG TPA: hypothetical protein VK969_00955, partial [Acidimicrobiia bacterium]|nr:hypothetical protein [Acidimicrobiia bacterium]